ncbi:MAG: hypothetical protein RLZZ67_609 [Candidatus Parcubacteria bacterium]|jgi:putative NADPH-quinone reductase
MKKIFILVGHPNKDSLSGHLADVYAESAAKAGHEVRRMNIGDMKFDPILHMGYKQRQELEPDLITLQENVTWAETLVFVFPTWWGDMPAILKGMIDRAWLPGFAYNMKPGSITWMRRLIGKRARLIITSQTNPLILSWIFRATFTHFRYLTLWFSGVSPVRMTRIGDVEKIAPERMAKIDKKIACLARRAK